MVRLDLLDDKIHMHALNFLLVNFRRDGGMHLKSINILLKSNLFQN